MCVPEGEKSTDIDPGSSDSSKARDQQDKTVISVPKSLEACPYRDSFVQQLELQSQSNVQ